MGRAGREERCIRHIEYDPLASQVSFHSSCARFKGFSGPIGSGKSQALCQEAIKLTYINAGRTGMLGAPTYPMLRDATQSTLFEILEKNRIPYEHNKAENTLTMKDTRSRVLFRAVDEFERLRGTNLAWFGIDELTYCQEQAWVVLEGRLRDPRAKRLCGFAGWTPKGHDWVYRRFLEEPVAGYEAIVAKPFENRHLLTRIPDFYERLKSSYDAKFYEQEVLGEYVQASAVLTLSGTPTADDYIGLTWQGEQYNYVLLPSDTLPSAVAALANIINDVQIGSSTIVATAAGAQITLTATLPAGFQQAPPSPSNSGTWIIPQVPMASASLGANWNRVGVYGFVSGAGTEYWTPWNAQFSGGTSPITWQFKLPFNALTDNNGCPVPMNAVRKMRWTWAADLSNGEFQGTEFVVNIAEWTVTGASDVYSVAGPGSFRIQDDNPIIQYSGSWASEAGNYSGGSIHSTTSTGDGLTCTYDAVIPHSLYLGTRGLDGGATISIAVDRTPVGTQTITSDGVSSVGENLNVPAEDVLMRIPLGQFGAGIHTVTIQSYGGQLYFDFFEIAVPTTILPEASNCGLSLATDWDTEHSLCLAPERTAWMISALGFGGRVNHYAGALWFYQLLQNGNQYASGTATFSGTPEFGAGYETQLMIGTAGDPTANVVLTHLHLIGDTAQTIAKAFELQLNDGFTSIRATSQGSQLRIISRTLGSGGNSVTIAVTTTCPSFSAQTSGGTLSGGIDGQWLTDLETMPRLNRAARDWTQAFFGALQTQGIPGTAALSMELGNGDPSDAGGNSTALSSRRCGAASDTVLADEFLAGEHRILARSIRRAGATHAERRGSTLRAIWRGAVVVLSE